MGVKHQNPGVVNRTVLWLNQCWFLHWLWGQIILMLDRARALSWVYLRVSSNWINMVHLKIVLKVKWYVFQYLFNKLDESLWCNLLPGKATSILLAWWGKKKKIQSKQNQSRCLCSHFSWILHMRLFALLHFTFVYSFLLVKVFVLYIVKVLTTYYKNIFFGI